MCIRDSLDWFRVFVFIILPIQFIANIYGFYQYIRDFNQYILCYIIIVLIASIITLISIAIVFWASIKQKPIGYKVIVSYSIYIIVYRILGFIIAYIYIINQNPIVTSEYISTYSIIDIIYVSFYIAIAIINLIYFSHRKFLFGISDEKSTPPESKEE